MGAAVPTALTALTEKTWRPKPSLLILSGELHPAQRFLSTLQKNLVPSCSVESTKRKVGLRRRVFAAGPKVIRVCGAT